MKAIKISKPHRADKFIHKKTNTPKHHNIGLKDIRLIEFGGFIINYQTSGFFKYIVTDNTRLEAQKAIQI